MATVARRIGSGSTGYEIWDRDAAILLEHFPTEEQALAYLRELVSGLNAEDTTKTMDRMQLVRVEGGETSTVVSEGVALLRRIGSTLDRQA